MPIINDLIGLNAYTPLEAFIKESECVSEKNYEDLIGVQSDTVKWGLNIPFDLNKEDYLKLRCDKKCPGLKKIIPVIQQANPILIYHDCIANNYSSMRRDCIGLPKPEEKLLKRFEIFTEKIFDKEIKPLLQEFEYSMNAYYNHLDVKQQSNLMKVDKNKLQRRHYGNFCKLEKQEVTSITKNPKNRNIASPNEEYKYVMGPVVYRLEQIFKKKFKGYSSGRSWSERETVLNQRRLRGLTKLVQGDGSGFDRTQYAALKRYCEMRIYKYLAEAGHIYHVDEATFLAQALCETITFNVQQMGKNGKYVEFTKLGKVTKTGTVQSGNCDTTFGNTLRMAMYNRFIMEELLLLNDWQYDLDCAGDDFATHVIPTISDNEIRWAYYTAFRPQIKGEDHTINHGLGQILKYLKIGSIETSDFCSTETFWSEHLQSYKIIRKIDRFMTLTAWSRKCLQLSKKDQLAYQKDLKVSNDMWIDGLPLLSQYNHLIGNYDLYQQHKFNHDKKSRQGKIKNKLPLEKPHYQELYDMAASARFENLRMLFDTNDAYAMMDRISTKQGCEEDFYDYLRRQYSLSRGEVTAAEATLLEALNKPLTYDIDLPILKVIGDQKELREQELKHDHILNGQDIWLYSLEEIQREYSRN